MNGNGTLTTTLTGSSRPQLDCYVIQTNFETIPWSLPLHEFRRDDLYLGSDDWITDKRLEQITHDSLNSQQSRIQYCVDYDGNFLHVRAIQGHSGENTVDHCLQDEVQIPYAWVKHICHVGPSLACNSITKTDILAGKQDNNTVFFTAVDPRNEPRRSRNSSHDVDQPRLIHLGKCAQCITPQFIGLT